jgi:hypothetical protein
VGCLLLQVLEKVRGTSEVDAEFEDMCDAAAEARKITNPYRNILQRQYRPQLCLSILIPFFQQFTGELCPSLHPIFNKQGLETTNFFSATRALRAPCFFSNQNRAATIVNIFQKPILFISFSNQGPCEHHV